MSVNEDKNIGDAVVDRETERPQERVPDGYWLKMGARAVDALTDSLRSDLTKRRRELLAEYLGQIMDNAYGMGIRLGELSAQVSEARSHKRGDSK
jgi:hypothetical protein